MLLTWLHNAGFFPIRWLSVGNHPQPHATYVRPGVAGVVRVVVLDTGQDAEVYTGTLFGAQLYYRGPIRNEAELQLLLPTCATAGWAA
ncbi:hypothetical protein [Hymenobacter mucosus]|uniref:Uncharacterized protein n=1 Tax=Hymenobacter mucosus TaxID=1411120 RepID=A0A238ZEK3_9BACT|nr:hypothetical protein [Hymenobacter mucosus]SNR81428.1 hypothetical protein SAMN06269173_107136 [Hymenobacter mucosus]